MSLSPLQLYQATADDDLRVAGWWYRMHQDGDLGDLYTEGNRTLASLFRLIAPPKALVYAADDHGIAVSVWSEQILGGVFLGLWARQDYRRSRSAFYVFLDALEWHFRAFSVVIGVTKHEKLLDAHRRLGYDVVKKLPSFFDGEDAWVVMLTKDEFLKTLVRYRRPSVVLTSVNGGDPRVVGG